MERIERLKGGSLLRMTLVECWRLSHSRSELEETKDMIHENKLVSSLFREVEATN